MDGLDPVGRVRMRLELRLRRDRRQRPRRAGELVVISSRRGFHPAGPGAGVQGTPSRLVPRWSVWQPSGAP